jgi:uncharacterized repeat protein (TIGR01451 family)
MKIHSSRRFGYLLLTGVASLAMFLGLLSLTAGLAASARAQSSAQSRAPIPPPVGYPKLKLSTKTVSPTLVNSGGATLVYNIQVRNTGATTATDINLADALPEGVSYNGDAWASHGQAPSLVSSTLVWTGEVGFDATVLLTFSVSVDPAFVGTLVNQAVISDANIARPVTVSAETVVTDEPILSIAKTSSPAKPGPGKTLVYQLQVSNWGQPILNQPITVTDRVPLSTTLRDVGPDGVDGGDRVTWTRQLSLALGESAYFSFSVDIDADAYSGTVIANEFYAVESLAGVVAGELYTVTSVDPIFLLSKSVWPDPPGSNRVMTYTLSLVNAGSLATSLVISDVVPEGAEYVQGGSVLEPVITWTLEALDTGESAEFSYMVYVSDVIGIPLVNQVYGACCAEGICQAGEPLTSFVQGPVFETFADVYPIAKKTGGEPFTPTLGVRNVGNGNALAATVYLTFYRTQLQDDDVVAYLPDGAEILLQRGEDCGSNLCRTFSWSGNIGHGELITFNVPEGIGTIGGEDFLKYIATINVSDTLSNDNTPTATAQDFGYIMHGPSIRAYKSAPAVIARGQLFTYTILVQNHGYSAQQAALLTDVIPLGVTFVRASHGGVSVALTGTLQTRIVSWTLPILSTGEEVMRTFTVRTDDDLPSGTLIINDNYEVFGYEDAAPGTLIFPGPQPVTTTVKEVGLIDSFKTVTPVLSLPGPDNLLTFVIHLVNSGAFSLTDVTVHDLLPWAEATYQRDAVASSGELVSDIVSLDWTGSIAPFSEERVTATVLVDADFEGVLTNTVTISHATLLSPVVRHARAYVTSKPVLFISKSATPAPARLDELLTYRLRVRNLGQKATALVITDLLPLNVTYVPTGGGVLVSNTVRWERAVLDTNKQAEFSFVVRVNDGPQIENALYGVNCAEGVLVMGAPLVTEVAREGSDIFLPLLLKIGP